MQREPTQAAVEGTLPSWLHGSLVRNGPGTFRGMKHLFDGYAMLVKVHFEGGQASVQQRCATPRVQHGTHVHFHGSCASWRGPLPKRPLCAVLVRLGSILTGKTLQPCRVFGWKAFVF